MEQFEQIRRDRDREGLSIRALAERHGVHRRAVRQALASPVPPAKRAPSSRPASKLGAYRELIDGWSIADLQAPRKQRHTAKRVWRRLVDEHGVEVAETTVRDHVRRRCREIGLGPREVFVPQIHAPGRTAEVDWGEADVDLAGARTRVHLFFMARKPGGLARSLAQERERGAWPGCFDELWRALTRRYGASEAARQMVDVLMLAREHGPAASSWRSAARWPPARSTAKPSLSSRAAPRGLGGPRGRWLG